MADVLLVLAYVLSAGIYFSERYRKNWLAVGVAGLIAFVSTVFTFKELANYFFGSSNIPAVQQNAPSVPPVIVESPINPTPAPDPTTIEMTYWNSIDKSDTDQLQSYLDQYPSGHFVAIAKRRLTSLLAPKPSRQTRAATVQTLTPGVPTETPPQQNAPAAEPQKLCVNFNDKTICDH